MMVIVVCMLILTILFMNGEKLGIRVLTDQDAEQNSDSVYFTNNDLDQDPDTEGATVISLEGDTASIEGTGAYVYDGGVVIASSGTYLVSGTLTDGSLTVDANENSKVWLILDGVTISCSDDAGIKVSEADKVFLVLAEGSENRVSSGETYSEEALSDGSDGAVFAHDDLTITGTGSLTVTAAYKHGIAANDDLVITGGTIQVEAEGDGIRANDSLRICRADITVSAGDDGMVTAGTEAFFYMESGSLSVTAEDNGISAAGDLTLAGGSLTVSAGDDALHSDMGFVMTDGTLDVPSSYEGIEALTVDIQGGEISIVSTDDGINANGGTDAFGMGGFGGGSFQEETGAGEETDTDTETWIHISGGTLTILNQGGRDADGIDSNGDILISGGTILVSLEGSGSNLAVDYNSEGGAACEITGGTLIACGGSSMAEAFDASSTQPSVLYVLSEGAEAGSLFRVLDEDGEVLLEWEVPQAYTCVTFSSPDLVLSGTYTVETGGTEEALTLSEVSTTVGTDGTGMTGGGAMWGRKSGMEASSSEGSSGEDFSGERPSPEDGTFEGRGGGRPGGGRPGSGSFPGRGTASDSEGTASGGEEAPPAPEGETAGAPEESMQEAPSMEDGSDPTGPGRDMTGPGMEEEAEEEEEAGSVMTDIRDFDSGVYLRLGLSVLALAGGLLAAFFYKRRS